MSITIRKATGEDKEFIITSIIEAEKSGSNIISYCAIFAISEAELKDLLSNILDEEIEGQELCIANFLIAEVNGEPAAALSAWIENEDGMTSNMIKSNLLMYLLDRNIIMNAAQSLALMNEINIPRTENTLQIECVYTRDAYRGQGLSGKLINAHIHQQQEAGKQFDTVQVILLKNNNGARKAYEKAGFVLAQEKRCANQDILKLLPDDTKILMERKLNTI